MFFVAKSNTVGDYGIFSWHETLSQLEPLQPHAHVFINQRHNFTRRGIASSLEKGMVWTDFHADVQ